jgi:hypothetical protein
MNRILSREGLYSYGYFPMVIFSQQLVYLEPCLPAGPEPTMVQGRQASGYVPDGAVQAQIPQTKACIWKIFVLKGKPKTIP